VPSLRTIGCPSNLCYYGRYRRVWKNLLQSPDLLLAARPQTLDPKLLAEKILTETELNSEIEPNNNIELNKVYKQTIELRKVFISLPNDTLIGSHRSTEQNQESNLGSSVCGLAANNKSGDCRRFFQTLRYLP
jgi:hypothetical protein